MKEVVDLIFYVVGIVMVIASWMVLYKDWELAIWLLGAAIFFRLERHSVKENGG